MGDDRADYVIGWSQGTRRGHVPRQGWRTCRYRYVHGVRSIFRSSLMPMYRSRSYWVRQVDLDPGPPSLHRHRRQCHVRRHRDNRTQPRLTAFEHHHHPPSARAAQRHAPPQLGSLRTIRGRRSERRASLRRTILSAEALGREQTYIGQPDRQRRWKPVCWTETDHCTCACHRAAEQVVDPRRGYLSYRYVLSLYMQMNEAERMPQTTRPTL